MNLVLIGYRGTGKSSVAQILSEMLGMPTCSTDSLLVERVGCSIPDYVAVHGWDAFRDEESAVIAEVASRDNVIVDAGGGVVVRAANVTTLKSSGVVFWLQASVDSIVSRIHTDNNRPSLTGAKSFTDEVQEVLAVRLPLYTAAADYVVETDGRSPEQVAGEIAARVRECAQY